MLNENPKSPNGKLAKKQTQKKVTKLTQTIAQDKKKKRKKRKRKARNESRLLNMKPYFERFKINVKEQLADKYIIYRYH